VEEHTRPKVLGTVGNHEIKNLWEGDLSLQIVNYLNSKKVPWTSVDVVRISYVGESFRPVILWIGVLPESLSAEDGTHLARSCQEVLVQLGIIDVDVETRCKVRNSSRPPSHLTLPWTSKTR